MSVILIHFHLLGGGIGPPAVPDPWLPEAAEGDDSLYPRVESDDALSGAPEGSDSLLPRVEYPK